MLLSRAQKRSQPMCSLTPVSLRPKSLEPVSSRCMDVGRLLYPGHHLLELAVSGQAVCIVATADEVLLHEDAWDGAPARQLGESVLDVGPVVALVQLLGAQTTVR